MSSFIRRHRRKLIWGGAAVGGLVIAARIVERQMIKEKIQILFLKKYISIIVLWIIIVKLIQNLAQIRYQK